MIAAEVLFALLAALAPAERGREIYERGDAAIQADMSGATVPASVVPCASCHGSDGRGRAEGGTVPSDIRHETLTRPYDVSAPSGRRHGPYDDRALVRAIAMGLDPAGNRLSEVMPRYQLSRDDAAALVAYLRTLGTRRDPGIDDDAITIGVLGVAPPAVADEVFGRRVIYRPVSALTEDVFAVITASVEAAMAEEADRIGIPIISLLSNQPPWGRRVFHLFGGIEEQQQVLARGAASGRELVPAAIADREIFSPQSKRSVTVSFVMLPAKRPPREQAALAAAALIADALRRAGRDVSRASFLEALETTSRFESEHAPPLTFTPTRHIGSTGAYLVDFDEGTPSPPRWVD